jgi:hypothetical protein
MTPTEALNDLRVAELDALLHVNADEVKRDGAGSR